MQRIWSQVVNQSLCKPGVTNQAVLAPSGLQWSTCPPYGCLTASSKVASRWGILVRCSALPSTTTCILAILSRVSLCLAPSSIRKLHDSVVPECTAGLVT
eukprot:5804315-Amphidinium_carterae.1